MDLLKKVANSFLGKEKKQDDFGTVLTLDIHTLGDDDAKVGTEEGYVRFKALLLELYHDVLCKDPNWHYFIEGTYNHLRFSNKFWPEVRDILNLHGVQHGPVKDWIDDQDITRKYQDVFQKMFHSFSLLAVQEYDEDEIDQLLDRVIHCFMNHQTIFLPKRRKKYGTNMEATLISNNAVSRAHYTGRLAEGSAIVEAYNAKLDEYREHCNNKVHEYSEDCREAMDSCKDSYIDVLKSIESSDEPFTSEDVKGMREAFEEAWENSEVIND